MEPSAKTDCAICESPFRIPVKVLDCGHSFCGVCIEPLVVERNDKSRVVPCQICEEVTPLKSIGGVARMTNNYALHAFIRFMNADSPDSIPLPDYRLMGPPPRKPSFVINNIVSSQLNASAESGGGNRIGQQQQQQSIRDSISASSGVTGSLTKSSSVSVMNAESHGSVGFINNNNTMTEMNQTNLDNNNNDNDSNKNSSTTAKIPSINTDSRNVGRNVSGGNHRENNNYSSSFPTRSPAMSLAVQNLLNPNNNSSNLNLVVTGQHPNNTPVQSHHNAPIQPQLPSSNTRQGMAGGPVFSNSFNGIMPGAVGGGFGGSFNGIEGLSPMFGNSLNAGAGFGNNNQNGLLGGYTALFGGPGFITNTNNNNFPNNVGNNNLMMNTNPPGSVDPGMFGAWICDYKDNVVGEITGNFVLSVVGANSLIVTGKSCTLEVEDNCEIYSSRTQKPCPPKHAITIEPMSPMYYMKFGDRSKIFFKDNSTVSAHLLAINLCSTEPIAAEGNHIIYAGDNCTIYLGVNSKVIRSGANTKYHTGVVTSPAPI